MSHTFTTNGWETLDHLLGINEPSRYILVQDRGFKIRKRIANFSEGLQKIRRHVSIMEACRRCSPRR